MSQFLAILLDGLLSIHELTLLFSSGQLVDLPGNATLSPLDLNREGLSDLPIYLHLMEESEEEEGVASDGQSKIQFTLSKLLLSPQREINGSKAHLKIAQCEKSPERKWTIDPEYIPPLLNLSSAFFAERMSKISWLLASVQRRLSEELAQPEFFPTERLEARLQLLVISKIQRLLHNAKGSLNLHPYRLYEELHELLDCVRTHEEGPSPLYDHENLGPLFTSLISQVERYLIAERKGFSSIRFEKKEGLYTIDTLPPTLSNAHEIYFVIQKPAISTALSLKGLKLTSRGRLGHIRQFALPGIPLIPIKKPSFFNTGFSEESEVFTIDQAGEWREALSEGNLVLFSTEPTSNFNLFLHWRGEHGTHR